MRKHNVLRKPTQQWYTAYRGRHCNSFTLTFAHFIQPLFSLTKNQKHDDVVYQVLPKILSDFKAWSARYFGDFHQGFPVDTVKPRYV